VTAYENAGVLALDAREDDHRVPVAVLTLTTRDQLSAGQYRVAVASFWRAFRKQWGRVEYCGFVEWTTGRGPRSGGVRRQHEHFLLKDLALRDGCYFTAAPGGWTPGAGRARCSCDQPRRCVECWTRREWRELAGAWVVNVTPLRSVHGATAYLAFHHDKLAQRPPAGWRGKRFRPSKGYFNRPVGELRDEVRLQRAERLAVKHGGDPAGVRARRLLDVFRGEVVHAREPDGRIAEGGPGRGYSDAELGELADLAAQGRLAETPVERAERLYGETVKREALRARRGRRRMQRAADRPLEGSRERPISK
jgi:hypothetical protein